MEEELLQRLRDAGVDLRASHDDRIIEATIDDIDQLDDKSASETADLLRFMTGIDR